MMRMMTRCALAAALLACNAMAMAATTGSVYMYTSGGARWLPNGYYSQQSANSTGLGTATQDISSLVTGTPFGGGPVTSAASTFASASIGLLKASSTSYLFVSRFPQNTGSYNSADSYAYSRASFSDQLTLSDPGHAFEQVTIHASLLLSGMLEGDPFGYSAFKVTGTGVAPGSTSFGTAHNINCANQWCGKSTPVGPPGQSYSWTIPVDIHARVSVATSLSYMLETESITGLLETFNGADTASTEVADIGHTVGWGGISSITIDSTGLPLTGYSLASLNGFDYSVAAVPEPETYAMMLAGLGLLGFVARHRKLKTA